MGVLLYCLFCMILVYVLYFRRDVKPPDADDVTNFARVQDSRSFDRRTAKPVSCVIEPVVCFESKDCAVMCSEPRVFCAGGICKIGENQDVPEPKCMPEHGVVAVLTGDNATGATEFMCLSLYPYVWDDQGKLRKGVCSVGEFLIDLTKEQYDPSKCVCLGGKLVFRSHDAYTVPVPRCVVSPEFYVGFQRRIDLRSAEEEEDVAYYSRFQNLGELENIW